jgi:hypothetical protein
VSVNESIQQAGIPELWHPALLRALQAPLVYEGFCTTEYEGDIQSAGDVVTIITTADPTVSDYARDATYTGEALPLAAQKLVITEQKKFLFRVNDLDIKQVKPATVEEQMSRAAYQLKKTRDSFIANTMVASVAEDNQLGQFAIGTGPGQDDIFELLNQMNTVLDDNYTPADNGTPALDPDGGPMGGFRFVALPPFATEMLVNDPRRSSFGTTENLRTYGDRYIGRTVAGLEVFKTTEAPTTTINDVVYRQVVAGWSQATAFAAQFTRYERQRIVGALADLHIGVDVYGAKGIRPNNLVLANMRRAA